MYTLDYKLCQHQCVINRVEIYHTRRTKILIQLLKNYIFCLSIFNVIFISI